MTLRLQDRPATTRPCLSAAPSFMRQKTANPPICMSQRYIDPANPCRASVCVVTRPAATALQSITLGYIRITFPDHPGAPGIEVHETGKIAAYHVGRPARCGPKHLLFRPSDRLDLRLDLGQFLLGEGQL